MTPDGMTSEKAQTLLDGATPGGWNFGTAPHPDSGLTKAEYVARTSQPEREDEPLWVAWAPNGTGDRFDYLVTAITGDGPTSEANAALVAAAPDLAAAYVAACADRNEDTARLAWLFSDRTQDGTLHHAVLVTEAEVGQLRAERDESRDQVQQVRQACAARWSTNQVHPWSIYRLILQALGDEPPLVDPNPERIVGQSDGRWGQ